MHEDTRWIDLWPGFRVTDSRITNDSAWLRLEPVRQLLRCGRCLGLADSVHDHCERSVRELPLAGRTLTLQVRLLRVNCPDCGPSLQRIRWLDRFARMTRAMAQAVARCCDKLPIKHVAQMFGLHWSTVQQLDKRRLTQIVTQLPRAQPQRLVMDEFALYKGHRYASVIMGADTRQVLYVAQGRTRESIRPFFEGLGPEGCKRIEAVAMDMNTAFDLEVRAHCPNAEVVYDLFHVVARFGREVVDRVRVDQANALRSAPAQRQVIKRSRWLLLRNRDNLGNEQAVKLEELLAANAPLATVYLLKTAIKEIWFAPSVRDGARRWKDWYRLAIESGIAPAIAFAKRLRKYLRGILASAIFPLNTSILEGVNNRIKVIKRMAYGFRDSAYFFLKIKAAFPGKAR